MRDKHQIIEEPCEVKVSCTVLKTNGVGDNLVEFNSRGEEYQPTWIYNAKIFEGSAIASIAVFLGASLTGACVAGGKNDD